MKNIQNKFALIADHESVSVNTNHIDAQGSHHGVISLFRRTATPRFFCLVCALWLGASLTLAGNAWSSPTENVAPKKDYLVSAILRDAVEGRPIQLAHSTQTAGSADEATGIGFVQAQTTAEKPSLENAPAPGGPVVISTYPFVQGGNIDTAWIDAETVLFGVGGKTAEAIGAQPGQFAVAALNVKTHSLRMVVVGKIIRYEDDLLITSVSDEPKSQIQCGPPDKPLQNAPNVSDPLCSKWRLGPPKNRYWIGMRDEHGYIDSGDRDERLPYAKAMLIKPSGSPVQVDMAFEFLGENLHYAPWLKAYLLVWRNRTVHSGRQFPFMSEEECRERMLNPQGHERNNNWLVQAAPFKTPEDRRRRDRILASSCRPLTPPNTFRLLKADGSLSELPVPAGYNNLFGLADSGKLTRRGLLMSPGRELPPEKEHLNGLWLATDDRNFTQIYKGGGIGVPSAYDEASTSADGCRVAFWTRPVKGRPRVFKVFDVCSAATSLPSIK